MPRMHRLIPGAFAVVLVLGAVRPAEAQFWKKVKKSVEKKVENRAQGAADRSVDAGLDRVQNAIECKVTDQACIDKAQAQGKPVKVVDENGQPVDSKAQAAQKLGEGVWANYDFVPGDSVLFQEDLTDVAVGDFPERVQLRSGNMETVEWQGRRWLRATSTGEFRLPLPEILPQRFTLEFDFAGAAGSVQSVFFGQGSVAHLRFSKAAGGLQGNGLNVFTYLQEKEPQTVSVRVMADGKHVKVYLDGNRVANVPQVDLGRANWISFRPNANAGASGAVFYGNFRVASGGRDLYDALSARGRVATHGILFASGSDQIRPESTPTIKQIAGILKQHPELHLSIEGHTDSVGDEASNRTLAERRAAAVRKLLIDSFGIDGSRLQARGMGECCPVTSNDTPEGRQQNRRVELVKIAN